MKDFTVTSPESKHFVSPDDNQKPLFNSGEFVKVSRDFSPGKNRQEGYGFIESVAGVGSATICSVQMVPHGDDGPRLHKGLTIDEITIEIFQRYFINGGESPRKRRKTESLEMTPPPAKKVVGEATTPMEILVNKMREGASRGRKKGWYLRELRPKDQRENPRLT